MGGGLGIYGGLRGADEREGVGMCWGGDWLGLWRKEGWLGGREIIKS